jgi:hypothetical protein
VNLSRFGLFTGRELSNAVMRAGQDGYLKGFQAGILAERRDAEGREAARWLAEINAGADPLASRRALRLVKGGE